jgi:hypothetical protein
MSTATGTAPIQPEPGLLGQTVVVIGGSSGIGLETARRARAEGAKLILAARNPERLEHVSGELGTLSTAAFDATNFDQLKDSSTSFQHRSITSWSPAPVPTIRRWRNSRSKRRGEMSKPISCRSQRRKEGSPGRHAPVHGRNRWPPYGTRTRSHLGSYCRASSHDQEPRSRTGPSPRQPYRRRLRRYSAFSISARRSAGGSTRATPRDAPDPPRSWPRGHRRPSRPPHDQHSPNRHNLRHRWRPAACRGVSPCRTRVLPAGLLVSEHLA